MLLHIQHHQTLSRDPSRATRGVTVVQAVPELHRLLLQHRYVKAEMAGNIWLRRELSQSVYLMH